MPTDTQLFVSLKLAFSRLSDPLSDYPSRSGITISSHADPTDCTLRRPTSESYKPSGRRVGRSGR